MITRKGAGRRLRNRRPEPLGRQPAHGADQRDFDLFVLDMFARGNVEGLLELSDEEILRESGNGGMEIKNWFCALGALPGARGGIIAYEAMEAWLTSMGFAELRGPRKRLVRDRRQMVERGSE